MISRTKSQLAAARTEAERHAREAKAIIDRAAAEKRDRTEDENAEIAEHTRAAEVVKKHIAELDELYEQEKRVAAISDEMGVKVDSIHDVQTPGKSAQEIKSLGDQFIESKGYQDLIAKGLSGDWSTGSIELATKGTLVTSPGTALTPDQRVPGIVETLFEQLTVADLIPSAQTGSSQVTYVEETAATNAADSVAETGLKPESTLTFGEQTEPVRKIATLLPVSDEMLEDAPQIQAYINQRLTLFVRQTEESQILRGSGTAPDIRGFIGTTRAIGTYARGTVDDNVEALFKAINGTRGSSFLEPDAIIMHPDNWQTTRLLQDSNGQFYGGGPFSIGPYGGPQGPAAAFTGDLLWGKRVVISTGVGSGTALLGAFREASQLYRRSGVTVEATNSHSTYFATNISTLRAEERFALAVYRPVAFTCVTGLA